jgi:hypothetical protein
MICHEKHQNPAASADHKAPIGARNMSGADENLFVFFVAKWFGGSV